MMKDMRDACIHFEFETKVFETCVLDVRICTSMIRVHEYLAVADLKRST